MFFCLIWGKSVSVAQLSFAMPLKADGEQSSSCPEGLWIKARSNPPLSHLVHTSQNFVCPLCFHWSQKEFPEQTVCDISLQVSYNVVSRSWNRQQDNKKLKLFFRALTLSYTSILLTSAQDRCINKEFCHRKLLELLASPTSEKNFGVIEKIFGLYFFYLFTWQPNEQTTQTKMTYRDYSFHEIPVKQWPLLTKYTISVSGATSFLRKMSTL